MAKKSSDAGKKSFTLNVNNPNVSMRGPGTGGALYGLGFVGALAYYWTTATSLWMGFIGLLKALVWPAVLVYGLMRSLGL
jgi:hypothetical protein